METLIYFTFDCDYFQPNQDEHVSVIPHQEVNFEPERKIKGFIHKFFQKVLFLYEQQESHWDKNNQDEDSSFSSPYSGRRYYSPATLSYQKAVFFQFLAILPPTVRNDLIFPKNNKGEREEKPAKDEMREKKFLKPVFASSYQLKRHSTHTAFSESLRGMLQEHIAANPFISSLSAAHQITFLDHFKGLPSGILPMDITIQKEWKILAFLEILDRGKEKILPGDEMMNHLTRGDRLKQLFHHFYFPNTPVIYINKDTISSRNRVTVAREVIKRIVFPELEEKSVGKREKKKDLLKAREESSDTDRHELDAMMTIEKMQTEGIQSDLVDKDEKKEQEKYEKCEGIVFIGFEANPKELSEWERKQKEMERKNEAETIRNREKEIKSENARHKILETTLNDDIPKRATSVQPLKEEEVPERLRGSILSELRKRSMEKENV
jgi:hypothetical protein